MNLRVLNKYTFIFIAFPWNIYRLQILPNSVFTYSNLSMGCTLNTLLISLYIWVHRTLTSCVFTTKVYKVCQFTTKIQKTSNVNAFHHNKLRSWSMKWNQTWSSISSGNHYLIITWHWPITWAQIGSRIMTYYLPWI